MKRGRIKLKNEPRTHMWTLLEALRVALRDDTDSDWSDAVRTQCVRLLCVSSRFDALREQVRHRMVSHALRRQPDPLAALATTSAPWARAVVAKHATLSSPVTHHTDPPASMAQLFERYRECMDFDLPRTLRRYESRLQQKTRPQRDRGPYTYQIVMRERIPDPSRVKQRRVSNGEAESRRFLTLNDPLAAMRFVLDFQAVQRHTPLERQISVNECGSHDGAWRKWVLDIDASEERIRASNFSTDVEALHVAVLDLAEAIAAALHRRGFLTRPCPFAVLSRHSLPRKYSWHVTLCAFASYPQWTRALRTVLEFDVQPESQTWAMARFIDEKVLANTRSQYMQIMGSTKVVAGVPGTGLCFRDEGLYYATMRPVPMPKAHRASLMAAATSCMLHDPWSQPFVGLARESQLDAEEQVLKRIVDETFPSKNRTKRTAPPCDDAHDALRRRAKTEGLDRLPAWMRGLVHVPGQTTLGHIPSMDNPEHRPRSLPKAHTVLLYAHVRGAACCPNALVNEGRLHRHTSDNAMLYACEAPHPRMLMRCFSTRCARGWVELSEAHLDQLKRLTEASADTVRWDALPASVAAWMRAPWIDTPLSPASEPNPPCPTTRVLLRATCAVMPFSPQRLCTEGLRAPTAEGGTIAVIERRMPNVHGVTYRLWAHCRSEGWTELTQSALRTK